MSPWALASWTMAGAFLCGFFTARGMFLAPLGIALLTFGFVRALVWTR